MQEAETRGRSSKLKISPCRAASNDEDSDSNGRECRCCGLRLGPTGTSKPPRRLAIPTSLLLGAYQVIEWFTDAPAQRGLGTAS